jgi:hypothetical protein
MEIPKTLFERLEFERGVREEESITATTPAVYPTQHDAK